MNWSLFAPIARTVLYEGQVLYPYRPSALKNRYPWTFGTLYPPDCPPEPCQFHLDVLIESGPPPNPTLRLCYLHQGLEYTLEARAPGAAAANDGIVCRIEAAVLAVEPGLWRLRVDAGNATRLEFGADPAAAVMQSAHLRCALEDGAFVSAQDPGARAPAAARCSNRGVYPVLIGPPGERRYLLAAPIILEDHPRIAPESLGDFCDATEMDELLTLRVMTLTQAEIDEARAAGGEARRIIDQCHPSALPPAEMAEAAAAGPDPRLARLHGGVRIAPWDAQAQPPVRARVGARELAVGDRVRIRPRPQPGRRGDIFDQVLDGRLARIQAIEQDMEGRLQIAVTIDDDPGRDLGAQRQSGHRFFFAPAELEPL